MVRVENFSRYVRTRRCAAFALLFLVSCLGFRAAAEQLDPHSAPHGVKGSSSTIEVGEAVHRAHVSLAPGDTLRVILVSSRPNGIRWSTSEHGARLIVPGNEVKRRAAQVPGTAVTVIFPFTARASGKGRLLFYSERGSGSATPRPVRTIDFAIFPSGSATKAGIRPEGRLFAKFRGKIPCADCSGIDETMAFYSRPHELGKGIYVDRMKYIGRGFTAIEAGRWRLRERRQPGSKADSYCIRAGGAASEWRCYRLNGELLFPLDEDGNPIRSPFNLSLRRIE